MPRGLLSSPPPGSLLGVAELDEGAGHAAPQRRLGPGVTAAPRGRFRRRRERRWRCRCCGWGLLRGGGPQPGRLQLLVQLVGGGGFEQPVPALAAGRREHRRHPRPVARAPPQQHPGVACPQTRLDGGRVQPGLSRGRRRRGHDDTAAVCRACPVGCCPSGVVAFTGAGCAAGAHDRSYCSMSRTSSVRQGPGINRCSPSGPGSNLVRGLRGSAPGYVRSAVAERSRPPGARWAASGTRGWWVPEAAASPGTTACSSPTVALMSWPPGSSAMVAARSHGQRPSGVRG